MQLPSDTGIPTADSHSAAALGAARRAAFDAARAAWPTLEVGFDDFCSHLASLGDDPQPPPELACLYLCLACARGCATACQLLEARYFPSLRAFVSKFDARPEVVDDLLQQVRYRLLVGPAPRIRSYRGQGSFEGWLRQVARTIAVDSIRINVGRERKKQRLSQDSACLDRLHGAIPLPPDEEIYRERSSNVIQRALHRCIVALPSEQRQLLRHYYVSGLSIDQLGALYGCDRSTAARRVVRGVQAIQRALRKELGGQLGSLGGAELESWAPLSYRRWGMEVERWLSS